MSAVLAMVERCRAHQPAEAAEPTHAELAPIRSGECCYVASSEVVPEEPMGDPAARRLDDER